MNKVVVLPMSMSLKNLFDCLVMTVTAIAGFIGIGKTRRIATAVSDPIFYLMAGGGLSLFFGQSSKCFSLGNRIPCLVRKQANISDPVVSS